MTDKVTLPWANAANRIHGWLERKWPELIGYEQLWITGSNVWRPLYDLDPDPDADLDMFHAVKDNPNANEWPLGPPLLTARERRDWDEIVGFINRLGLSDPPGAKKRRDLEYQGINSRRRYTERGWVDLWQTYMTPVQQIAQYPSESHGQARAAYNPATQALIVLANPIITTTGAFEEAEHKTTHWGSYYDQLRAR